MTPTDAVATFPDRNTFRLEVFYPHPPARVWDAITDPTQLAIWFMPIDIEPRVGGRVILAYDRGKLGRPAEGTVTVFDVLSVLEYRFAKGPWEWPESDLRFELSADDNGCRLVFTQRVVPDTVWARDSEGQVGGPGTVHPGACAGWHAFLQESLRRYLDVNESPINGDAFGLPEALRKRGLAQPAVARFRSRSRSCSGSSTIPTDSIAQESPTSPCWSRTSTRSTPAPSPRARPK